MNDGLHARGEKQSTTMTPDDDALHAIASAAIDASSAGGSFNVTQALALALSATFANATLLSQLVAPALAKQLEPTPPSAATPLRELIAAPLTGVPAAELVASIHARGWAVLDSALPADLVDGAAREAVEMLHSGWMKRQEKLGALRGDMNGAMRPGSPQAALFPQLAAVVDRLSAAARRLSAHGVNGAAPGALVPDPKGGMVACYRNGERYVRHVDTAADPSGAYGDSSKRRVTLIAYLRTAAAAAWSPADGGELRLWPGWTLGQEARAPSRAPPAIDVEPHGGRLAAFASATFHEVRPLLSPPTAPPRCAVTLWVVDGGEQQESEDPSARAAAAFGRRLRAAQPALL